MQLSRDKLLDAYTRMKKIRVFEETMRDEFAKGTVPAFIHLYIGQEAIATGICIELTDQDTISSTHRGHGHCIAKNSNLEKMTMEIFCRADGSVRRQRRVDAHRRFIESRHAGGQCDSRRECPTTGGRRQH